MRSHTDCADSARLAAGLALAALSAKRDPAFADVPTAVEQGVNVVADAWRGIAVPRGNPKAAIARLEDAIRRTIASPEFGRLMAKEDADLAHIIQTLGLKKSLN